MCVYLYLIDNPFSVLCLVFLVHNSGLLLIIQSERSPDHNRKTNIVIHGLKIGKEEEKMEKVLDMCQAMDVVMFSSNIEDITWLGRFEPGAVQPPPLRETFQFQYQRNNILRKRSKLLNKPQFSSVDINPDESIEVRRIKGIFRRIANKAREAGKTVMYRADWII